MKVLSPFFNPSFLFFGSFCFYPSLTLISSPLYPLHLSSTFRLYSSAFYDQHMVPFQPPEIVTTPLEDLLLQVPVALTLSYPFYLCFVLFYLSAAYLYLPYHVSPCLSLYLCVIDAVTGYIGGGELPLPHSSSISIYRESPHPPHQPRGHHIPCESEEPGSRIPSYR